MRYAILADIHANLAALEAVLKDIQDKGGADRFWSLGDVVGYGPDPVRCIQRLRELDPRGVAGNHDWAAAGRMDLGEFNPDAAAACRWSAQNLGAEEKRYLEEQPLVSKEGDFTLVHGSLREPIWEYLLSPAGAEASFQLLETPFCLVGHSHVPLLFQESFPGGPCRLRVMEEEAIKLEAQRLILNPGGVGQPRDGDPRASYLLYDSEKKSLWHHRVPYDIESTQRRMLSLGLPRGLAERLSYGL